MRFTDEMIRNLKRDMGTTTTFMGYDIAALLARLESAEVPLRHEHEAIGGTKTDGSLPCGNKCWSDNSCPVTRDAHALWRQISGRL